MHCFTHCTLTSKSFLNSWMLSIIIGDIVWQKMLLSMWKPYTDIKEMAYYLILMSGSLALVTESSLQCSVNDSFLFQNVLRELERRKADLKSITESCTALQALVEGSETSLEEKLCVLNAGWSRVRTWTEDWCDTLLVSCLWQILQVVFPLHTWRSWNFHLCLFAEMWSFYGASWS